MNDGTSTRPHWRFLLVTGLLFIWNALGCVNFVMQMNPEMVASYRESEQLIIQGRPVWATAGFAIAVFGGALGCLLLLFRKSSAVYVLIASFAGVIVAVGHSMTVGASYSPGEIAGIVVMPVAVAVFLIWYARYTKRKGW